MNANLNFYDKLSSAELLQKKNPGRGGRVDYAVLNKIKKAFVPTLLDSATHSIFNPELKKLKWWLAGGALCNYYSKFQRSVNDYDIFFKNADDREGFKQALIAMGAKMLYETDNTECYQMQYRTEKIDLVKNFYESPKECIASFDLTVTQCAIDTEGNLFYTDAFFEDVALKRIQVSAFDKSLSAFIRVPKYIKKGFTVSQDEMVKIMQEIRKVPLPEFNGFVAGLQTIKHLDAYGNTTEENISTYGV